MGKQKNILYYGEIKYNSTIKFMELKKDISINGGLLDI